MKSKIVVLDTKPSFPLQPLFQEVWETRYSGMVEWQDPQMHGGIKRVDPAANEVVTDLATYKAALVNVIPAQMAGKIARDGELTDATGFCPVDADTMKSSIDRNIFILGDAASTGDIPKAASSAASQAKIAAAMIRAELADGRPEFSPRYAAACWSLAAPDDALKIRGSYAPRGRRIQQTASEISQEGESAEIRKANAQASLDWYAAITTEMFG
jgi:NADPH-dependent 2,4-dienoyl-CoA reductase/sulfur reductase-like enzyme